MVIVKFIQDGLKCQLEGETDTYKYSKNMEMQFVKDENHQDYEVTVFFLDQEKNEGKIDIDENGVFQLGERFFLRKEPFYLSFQLEKGDEIQHLGNYKMRVCDAIGNGSSPLPENPKIWIEYVDEEMDKYFNENFQPKLDKFNADYEEIKKIAASGGSGSSITVDSELNSTSKNPVQNQAIYKEFSNLNKKVENIPTNFKKINNTEITGDGNIDIPIVNVDAELNETSTNAIQNQAVAKELAEKLSKNGLKTINGQSLVGSGNIELSAGDNDYELPIANNETLGGVMPIAKTTEMSQGVGVDENGRLFTFPSGNSSTNSYTNIRIDKLASGTIESGTTANTAIETGVSYDVLREYDMFEICMYGSSDQGTWSIYPQGGNTALWARISWGTGRSKVVFKKLFKDYYEPYYKDKVNTEIISISPSAPYLNTMMYKSMSYLMKLDSYYKGKTIMLLSSTDITADIAWAITACKFE